MAKLSRESRLRERRMEKKARKDRRKQAALDGPPIDELGNPMTPLDLDGNPLPVVDEFGNPMDDDADDSDSESEAADVDIPSRN
jgi:hypothetical protein